MTADRERKTAQAIKLQAVKAEDRMKLRISSYQYLLP